MPGPTAAQVRIELARRAEGLRLQLYRLQRLANELRQGQPPPSLEDEYEPPSEEVDLLTIINCVLNDHVLPAIEDLERAARRGKRRRKVGRPQ